MPMNANARQALIRLCRDKDIPIDNEPWQNFMASLNTRQAIVVDVKNEEQVVWLMQKVAALNEEDGNNIKVRASAGWANEDPYCGCSCFGFFSKAQTNRYNESYSFSPGAIGDLIIRFNPEYQKHGLNVSPIREPIDVNADNPIKRLKPFEVNVPAGMQIKALADYLEKQKKSLTTVSMLSYASAIGLAMNAGHGTGRDESSFAGLIRELRICDNHGNIRTLSIGHNDFETLRAAKAGLLGIVLSAKLRCVEGFKLKETIKNYVSLEALSGELQDLLQNNQYFTLMHMPSYLPDVIADNLIPNWHVRLWNYSTEKSTISGPTYEADIESFTQELSAKIGASVQEFLLDNELYKLLPAFMTVAASTVTATRGTKEEVGKENHMTHYQVAFPKKITDLSFLVPVSDENCGAVLTQHLAKIDALLDEAREANTYPVTYAVYVRYFKGTNGGLSTSQTQENERTLAIEVVSHPGAPGLAHFEKKLTAYFKEQGVARFHLGKEIPESAGNYRDFLGGEAVDAFIGALNRWYGQESDFPKSPFITEYFEQMLGQKPMPEPEEEHGEEALIANDKARVPYHSKEELIEFLNGLIKQMDKKVAKAAKQNPKTNDVYQLFKKNVAEEIQHLRQQMASHDLVH